MRNIIQSKDGDYDDDYYYNDDDDDDDDDDAHHALINFFFLLATFYFYPQPSSPQRWKQSEPLIFCQHPLEKWNLKGSFFVGNFEKGERPQLMHLQYTLPPLQYNFFMT